MIVDGGYTLKGEYINARTKVAIQCSEGHVFMITPNNWKKGHRCKECFKIRQKNRMFGCSELVNKGIHYNNTTGEKTYNKPKVIVSKIGEGQKVLFAKYLKMFKRVKGEGVAEVMVKGREFEIRCRGDKMVIWIMDEMNDLHPKDIYPVYLDVSDYQTDEDYIMNWIKEKILV